MKVQDAYTAWSVTYDEDRNRTRDLDREVTAATLGGIRDGVFGGAAASPDCAAPATLGAAPSSAAPFGAVVEIGCGTGKNTLFLASLAGQVTALDFSAGMLARAREKVAAAGVTNVTFVETDLTQPWPVAAGGADLVVCNLVLEHIADLHFIFAAAARALRPRGCFFVCELHPFRQYLGTQATFQRAGTAGEAGTAAEASAAGEAVLIDAYVHHMGDFLAAAKAAGMTMDSLKEWWHAEDAGKPPRLVSFLFRKPPAL
jgi:malonyl-CoA O-methyltransferase